nr:hypothetical protein GCM10020092_038380 [Actinoplanes digitatis]
MPGARHVVGCKVTADTAYGVVCDMFGNVKHSGRAALPVPGADGAVSVAGTVKVIAQLVSRLARRVPSVDGLGVSLGGVVADRSVVREGTFLGWRDVDLAGPLRQRTGLPVTIANDVAALAREQLWFGAGRTHSTFGVITVGAGLGFGVVREGVAVEELIDNGHLLAHAPVDTRGPECTLGHRGCAAAFLNREDIERHASAAAGRPVTFGDLIRARAAGDRAADRLLDGAAHALGHLIATFAGALQTTCVVLAGEDVADLAGDAGHERGARRPATAGPARESAVHPRHHHHPAHLQRLGTRRRGGGHPEHPRRLLRRARRGRRAGIARRPRRHRVMVAGRCSVPDRRPRPRRRRRSCGKSPSGVPRSG